MCSLSAGGGAKKKCICVVNTCFELTLLSALPSTSSIGINGKLYNEKWKKKHVFYL